MLLSSLLQCMESCLNQNIKQPDKMNTDETSVPMNDQGFHDPGTKTRPQWTGSCAQMNISSGFWISNMSTLKSTLVSNPAILKHWTDHCEDRGFFSGQKLQRPERFKETFCGSSLIAFKQPLKHKKLLWDYGTHGVLALWQPLQGLAVLPVFFGCLPFQCRDQFLPLIQKYLNTELVTVKKWVSESDS